MKDVKIAVGMITFNSDFVLKQVLDCIYPYVEQIIIVDGCVRYWADRGFTKSTDTTGDILTTYPDTGNKITWIKAVAEEKTQLCQKFMPALMSDITHLWCMDSDECFKSEDILKIKNVLAELDPISVGFQSNTFFGGFNHILSGFEKDHSFKRILKYEHGCTYDQHRPPTLSVQNKYPNGLHLSGKEMFDRYGVSMYHYSYVSAKGVKEKIDYYEDAVISKGMCITNYFNKIWLSWVNGTPEHRSAIEAEHAGVHEFVKSYRGLCYTVPFNGTHPEPIQRDMPQLLEKFNHQLNSFL